MRKKKHTVSAAVLILILLFTSLSSSSCKPKYKEYNYQFLGTFDTVVNIVGHMTSQKKFDELKTYAEKRFNELNKLFDIYHEYDGIKNIKNINDNAGISPVVVEEEILNLLILSKTWYTKTNGKVNVAFGNVLKIWHDYRTKADPEDDNPEIPTIEELQKANENVSIDSIVLNLNNKTVFISDPKVRLDVGAVAKGYATEIVVDELQELGFDSFAISAGGNVKISGKPLSKDRDNWIIGIQNPEPDEDLIPSDDLIDRIAANDTSIVTSGWYQRYFISGGKIYHHIIDPETLFPANYYKAVTIVYPDSGICDILSTAIMLMPYETAAEFIKGIEGAQAYFVLFDGTVKTTAGMAKMLVAK